MFLGGESYFVRAHTLRSNKQDVFPRLNVVNREAHLMPNCLLGQLCVIMRQRFRKENHQLVCNVGVGSSDLFRDQIYYYDCSWAYLCFNDYINLF